MSRKRIGLFAIQLDKKNGVYRSGDTIHGNVVVEVTESIKIRGIRLRFQGKAHVRWYETDQSGIGITRMSSKQDFIATENYFDTTVMLTGKDEVTLEPNRYRYPFTFKLREGLPTSYEGKYGRIRYSVDSTVDIPWARDKRTKKPFTILDTVDLNRYQGIREEKQEEIELNLSYWCCAPKSVRVVVRVEKMGYVPGEAVRIHAEVTASSLRIKSTEAELIQVIRFHAHKQSKFGSSSSQQDVRLLQHTVASIRKTGLGSDTWQGEQLQVPSLPPTNKKERSVIDILYRIMFTVKFAGQRKDVHVKIPIVIGNVPLADKFHAYRAPPPKSSLELPKKAIQTALITPMIPAIPAPDFLESAMGKATMDDSDSDEDTKDIMLGYAPAYEFFDWKSV